MCAASVVFFFSVDSNSLLGLSSPTLTGEINNKMLGKNQYLLLPHIPSSRDNNRIDSSNNITATSNETSSPSSSETIMDTATQSSSLNQNFLMEGEHQEQLENQIAIIDENDESYFQIFNQPLRFSTENNTEVIAQVGTTAHLPCMIHNIGEGVVSWQWRSFFGIKNWLKFQFVRYLGYVEKDTIFSPSVSSPTTVTIDSVRCIWKIQKWARSGCSTNENSM